MPLEFIDESGKFRRFRLEQQTQAEQLGRHACVGCVFDIPRDCTMPFAVDDDINMACLRYTKTVWKEVK